MISERDYLKMRAEIENRCRLDLEALDRVWSMAHKGEPTPQKKGAIAAMVKRVDDALGTAEVVFINKRASVRVALESLTGNFGSKDVRDALVRVNPEASNQITDNQLSSIIARLADLKEIHAVVPKAGRTPAVYAHGPKQEAQAS